MENDPKKKYVLPEDWPFKDARDLFFEPDVRGADDPLCDFKWDKPDIEGLVHFLVTEKGFFFVLCVLLGLCPYPSCQ